MIYINPMQLLTFYWTLIKNNKIWLRRVTYWAIGWLIVGFIIYLARPDLAPKFLDMLRETFKDIMADEQFTISWKTVVAIFKNNVRACLTILFLGIVLGILPIISLASNGFLIGFLISYFITMGADGNLFTKIGTVFLLLVPHGIIEIPAFLIAAAFGVRLGLFWKVPGTMKKRQKFLLCLKQNLQLAPLLVVLLFVAAVLEVFVSGSLADYFLIKGWGAS